EKPLEIRLHGKNLEQLALAGEQVRRHLAAYAGVSEIEVDLIPGKLEMQVSLKPLARTLGLAEADLAVQLREGFHGGEAVRLLRAGSEVKVQVRYPRDQRRSLSDVEGMRVRTLGGQEIPFSEAASVKMVRGYSTIWRQDGRRRVRIKANVDERLASTEDILADMSAAFLPDMEQRMAVQAPEAELSFSLGGQWAQMRESMGSLKTGYFMALVAIYAILASMMRSYVQPLIITAAIPLGMVGVAVGHVIMGYSLTLLSVFGAVALTGVVVNDALVLIVHINRNVRAGLPVFDAIVDGGVSRFRAVILTTVTTVAGLMPLLFERSSQATQLIPMAISLAFGLAVATSLTLLVVPALYLVVNDLRRLTRWLYAGGPFPSAEAVEQSAMDSTEAIPAG
ncbi:MAG: efflux RND transporter permease subunit, partial [Phycisphaerae bacterium]